MQRLKYFYPAPKAGKHELHELTRISKDVSDIVLENVTINGKIERTEYDSPLEDSENLKIEW